MQTEIPTVLRQHITIAKRNEAHPALGVTAAGIPNLEQYGIEEGDKVEVAVTLKKVTE